MGRRTSLDPEFRTWDDLAASAEEKKPSAPVPSAPRSPRRPLELLWPILRSSQSVFAEALGRALAAGLEFDHALMLAARVNPSRRFRRALHRMRLFVRQGYVPEEALKRTGARVDPALIAVFRLGSGDGTLALADELRAVARSLHPRASRSFARRIGRSRRAVQFASALARRLRQEGLTVRAVTEAGAVASAGSRRFARMIERIAADMRDGGTLMDGLRRYRRQFDPLFIASLEEADSKDQMRRVLEQLGEDA